MCKKGEGMGDSKVHQTRHFPREEEKTREDGDRQWHHAGGPFIVLLCIKMFLCLVATSTSLVFFLIASFNPTTCTSQGIQT
jgi:hypothetical protein